MAKGVEDTAFYRYVRLLALNEVGGDPARFGHLRRGRSTRRTPQRAARFPRHAPARRRRTTRSAAPTCARASARSPGSPSEWRERVLRWHELNARACATGDAPDWTEELLRLPDARRRLADRARPARAPTSRRRCARRSATRTGSSRTRRWEAAVKRFARGLLEHEPFLADFEPFAAEVAAARASARRSASSSCGSPRPACPTSTTATSCRTSRSSIPTTAGRSTGSCGARLLDELLSGAPPREETRKLALIARALDLRRRRPSRSSAATCRSTPGRA